MTDAKLELVPITSPSVAEPIQSAEATTGESQDDRKGSGGSTHPKSPAADPDPAPSSPSSPPAAQATWRSWGPFDRTVSYRLPAELVQELEDRIWRMRLPVGVTVAAAFAQLLDLADEELQALVERAEEAKPRRRLRSTSG
jgi:hypothetical protein